LSKSVPAASEFQSDPYVLSAGGRKWGNLSLCTEPPDATSLFLFWILMSEIEKQPIVFLFLSQIFLVFYEPMFLIAQPEI